MLKGGASSSSEADTESFDSLEARFARMHIEAALQRSTDAAYLRSSLPKDYNHLDTESYSHLEGVREILTEKMLEVQRKLAAPSLPLAPQSSSALPPPSSSLASQSSNSGDSIDHQGEPKNASTLESGKAVDAEPVELSASQRKEIEEQLREAAELQIQNLQKFRLTDQLFQRKTRVGQAVLLELKAKLNNVPATTQNIGRLTHDWIEEIRKNQAIASGNVKGVIDASSAQFPSIQSPHVLSYLFHILNPKIKVLDAIVSEIRRLQIGDSNDNPELVAAILEEVKAEQVRHDKERIARLTEIAPYAGFVQRVSDWFTKIPDSLKYAEMEERNRLRQFEPTHEEGKATRKEARRRVEGYEPRGIQRDKKAVAFEFSKDLKRAGQSVVKQMGELSQRMRLENQNDLGIVNQSRSRQPIVSAMTTFKPIYQTKFVGARLDEGAPSPFPERKAHAMKVASDFVPKRQRVDALLHGAQRAETDKVLEDLEARVKKNVLR